MGVTLDDYLREVDRWKQEVSDETAKLDPAGRARHDQEALEWLEEVLGRQLNRAPRHDAEPSGGATVRS